MANNIIRRTWKQGGLVNIEDLRGFTFQAEEGGHTFLISGEDENGEPLALSGTPAGVLLRADGQDVALTCSVSDGVVSATLPAGAYAVPGRAGITIFLTSDGQKTAIYAAIGSVATTSSGVVAPPAGSSVVDLVNAIEAAIALIPASDTNLKAAIAPTYSTDAVYALGSYAWYDGKLYRCISAITSGETWTSGHWTLANIGDDLTGLKNALAVDFLWLEQGAFDTDSDISTDSSNNGRGRSRVFTIETPTTIIPLTDSYKYHVYKQAPSGLPERLTSSYLSTPFVIDDLTASYRVLVQNAVGSGSVTPTAGKLYFSLTGLIKEEDDFQKKTDAGIAAIREEISDLDNIRNAIGFDLVLDTELNYFSTSDLAQETDNNSRGRTGLFKLYAPVTIQFSGQPDYGFKIYKQTFSGDTQTTEDLSGTWQYSYSATIETVDPEANYRIMIRNTAGTSLLNVDFSTLYFTCRKIGTDRKDYFTGYDAEEQKLYDAVENGRTANKIVIALSTDNHYNDTDLNDFKQAKFAEAIAKVAKKCRVDFIVNLGDIIEGYDDDLSVSDYKYQYVNYTRLRKMINALSATDLPIVYAAGHHEMFPISDQIDSGTGARTENRGYNMHDVWRQTFGVFRSGTSKKGFRRAIFDASTDDDPENSLSFWFDYTKGEGTVRFIVVDGCDYKSRGYSQGTIDFVSGALSDAKSSGLPVIMMSHIPPVSAGVIGATTAAATNEQEFNDAIEEVGANIIAYLHGHTHFDNIITTGLNKDYPVIGFDCQKMYRQWSTAPSIYGNPTCPSRTIDTYSEYAFDIVMIDTVTGEINCYRFGAGDTGTYPTRSANNT